MDVFTHEGLFALTQVIFIDLVLAGDNAVVIGMAAAGLPAGQRGKAILAGIAVATVLRILFAVIAVSLLEIVGLVLAGGLLLLWVCWKMWGELRAQGKHLDEESGDGACGKDTRPGAPIKTFRQAAVQIVVADLSMSLDNVLAVAGAAREHPTVLVIGLLLSITLTGLLASYIAKLLNRQRWIGYIGLLIILYVALEMIYRGFMHAVLPVMHSAGMWPF